MEESPTWCLGKLSKLGQRLGGSVLLLILGLSSLYNLVHENI